MKQTNFFPPAPPAGLVRLSWRVLGIGLAVSALAACGPSTAAENTPAAAPVAATPAAAPEVAPAATPARDSVKAAPVKPAAEEAAAKPKPVRPVPVAAAPETAPAAEAATPAAEAAAPAPAVEPAAPAPAASHLQSGRVLDENGQPLAGATVMLKGSHTISTTDASGNYSLEVPAGDNTLVFGYAGYSDETVSGKEGQPVSVTLVPEPGSKKGRKRRN